jgi:hypothetical protein
MPRSGAVRNRVRRVPDLVVVEDLAVLERFGAGHGAGFGSFLTCGAEPDQRAGERAELHASS